MVNGLLGTRTQKQFIQKVRKVILVLLASNLVKTLVSWCIHMDMIGVLELSKALKYKISYKCSYICLSVKFFIPSLKYIYDIFLIKLMNFVLKLCLIGYLFYFQQMHDSR